MEKPIAPRPEEIVEKILAAAEGREFRTFVIGFERTGDWTREEHEALYRPAKIAAGEELLRRWPAQDVDFERPEMRFNLRLDGTVSAEAMPLHIGGRYRKLSREIPSTRWIHHRCGGRGCPVCGHTGNLCGPSIQELAEGPFLAASGGEKLLLHGAGREDTDVRMLGRGRPFVIEIAEPRRRTLDLPSIEAEVNRRAAGLAEIGRLAPAAREAVRAVKEAEAEKTYRVVVRAASPLPADAAERAAGLAGRDIRQVTPRRVSARRPDGMLRMKKVIESRWLGPFEGGWLWEVRTASGTYVKELVSGDAGRTTPSLSEVLGVLCTTAVLDVLEIHWDPPWER